MAEQRGSETARAVTKAGALGGSGSLLGYLYFYASEIIDWNVRAIFQPDNLETLVTWALAFFGITGAVAGWNRAQPAPQTPPQGNTQSDTQSNAGVVGGQVGGLPPRQVGVTPTPPAPTSNWKWSSRSLEMLSGVHVDLHDLATEALKHSPYDFGIAYPTGGRRDLDQQKGLIKAGASSLLNSRHLHGFAVDIVVYDEHGRYTEDPQYYIAVEKAWRVASMKTGIPYRWGGDWTDPVDTPHYELPKYLYPDNPDILLS